MDADHRSNRTSALIVTTLGSFLIPFMGSSINIALPAIGKEFGMNAILLSWVTTSYLLTVAIFLVPSGRIGDIYGRKRVFLYGFIIYTFSSFLSATSPSAFSLILFRTLQGIGASMTFSTGVAILTSVFPGGERGKVLGINVAAVYSGLSCGPILGGFLIHHFGWRTIFLFNLPFGLLVVFFTFWKLRGEWAEARGERFDLAGSILYGFVLGTMIYGFSLLPGIWGAFLILLSVAGTWAFIKLEIRLRNPVFDMNLLRKNRVFALSNLAALINYSATFAVSFLLSLYLQLIKGLSPQDAGMIMVSQPIVQAAFSPLAGRLSDRIEPRIVASTGMALTAIGLSLFIFLDGETATSFIVASLVLIGFGFALFSSPNTNAVMGSVERRFYGVASGILGTMRATGMMFSMGMVMLLFSLYIGRVQITPSHYVLFVKSVRVGFTIFAGLRLVGIFASLSRGRVR
ncbi:MAG: MFS transporter [Syntrophaceae bacterium]|nr:MFS transporter [Syntrophaceae bacterium]